MRAAGAMPLNGTPVPARPAMMPATIVPCPTSSHWPLWFGS